MVDRERERRTRSGKEIQYELGKGLVTTKYSLTLSHFSFRLCLSAIINSCGVLSDSRTHALSLSLEVVMGKHGTHGHKQKTAFYNNTPGGLGHTLNKELKKHVKKEYVRSTRHTTDSDGTGGGDLQSVTEVRSMK